MSAREENIRVRIEAVSDLPDLASQMDELIRLTKQQQEITQQSALAARTGAIQQVTAIESVTDALKKQQSESDKAGKTTAESNDKVSKSFDALGGQVRSFTSLLATAFAVSEIKSFGLDIIDAKTKIDNLKISLDVMLGSKKESAVLYADIVKLAKETPFTLEEVADNVVKLKAYNIATADLIPTVNALGNIAAAVGKDKLPQLTLAYGQVINMGRLLGTETRQFIEAGVPLYDLLATSMQKPKSEVIALAAEHRIMAADVKKAVMDASESGGKYYGLMALQAKTVGGEVDKMKDSYQQAKVLIGDYFEDTIQSGTRRLNGLLEATVGSNSAITRTIDIVKSAAAFVLTLTAATKAQGAADVVVTAYQTAKNIVYGEYLLVMRAATAQQTVFTAAQLEAVVAAEGFNAALAANPVGLVVTAVGALVTAFFAYKAITDEVVSAMGEEELKLKAQKADLNTLADAALNAASGTKQRKEAIELLIQKYPEYFSGLSTERTSNQQLKTILDSVNSSYSKRIDLAREAYKTEGIANAQKELFEKEEAFFKSLAKLNDDHTLEVQFGGSVKKLVETLDAGGVSAEKLRAKLNESASGGAEFFAASARSIAAQFSSIEKQGLDSTIRTKKIGDDARNVEVEAIQKHYDVLRDQADGNATKIAQINAEEKTALAKANGTYREKEIKDLTDHAEKTKQVVLLTDKQIALIKGESNQNEEVDRTKQLQNQLAFLGKQEDAEIESVKKITVNKNISNAALAALQEQARLKALAIDAKYDLKRTEIIEELEVEEQKNFLLKVQESNDKVAVLTAKRLEAERMLTKLNDAATNDERLAALREYNQKFTENLQQQGVEQLKIQLDNSKKALDDIVAKNGEKGDAYRKAYAAWLKDNEQYNTALTQQTIKTVKDLVKTNEDYEKEIRDAHRETAKLEKDTLEQTTQNRKQFIAGMANLVSQDGSFLGQMTGGLVALYNSIDGLNTKQLAAAKSALKGAEDNLAVIKGMYSDATAEGAAAIANAEENVARAQGDVAKAEEISGQAVLGIMSTIYQVLSTIAAAYNQMVAETYKAVAEGLGKTRQAYADFNKFVVDSARASHEEELSSFTGSLEEKLKLINSYYDKEVEFAKGTAKVDAELAFQQQMAQVRADAGNDIGKYLDGIVRAEADKNNRVQQLNITNAEESIKKAGEIRDAKFAAIDAELAHFKAAEEEKTDLLNKELDAQKAANAQFYSDKELRLQEDDVYRKSLLDAGEAREVQALEAAKQRELDRATNAGATAEEIARITNAFNKLIADKHAEYQTAMGDKSKETSLANAEAKREETDKIAALEKDTAAKIADLQQQIVEAEKRAADQKVQVNQDYANAVQEANRQIFEANKAIKLAELKAEIAILNGKRNWAGIGNGAIDAAIAGIQGSIAEISGSFATIEEKQDYDAGAIAKYVAGIEGFTGIKISTPFRTDDYSPVNSAFTKDGKPVQITFNASGKVIKVYDAAGNKFYAAYADGFVPSTGEHFFQGSPYVEGLGYPDGRDTVPAMINKGERVLSTADNLAIGGRDLTNESLVQKVKYVDLLTARYPQYQMPQQMNFGQLRIPAEIMKEQHNQRADLTELMRAFNSMEQTFKRKELVSIQMNEAGFTKSIITQQAKINHMTNLFTR